jgi:hypothetical protein
MTNPPGENPPAEWAFRYFREGGRHLGQGAAGYVSALTARPRNYFAERAEGIRKFLNGRMGAVNNFASQYATSIGGFCWEYGDKLKRAAAEREGQFAPQREERRAATEKERRAYWERRNEQERARSMGHEIW